MTCMYYVTDQSLITDLSPLLDSPSDWDLALGCSIAHCPEPLNTLINRTVDVPPTQGQRTIGGKEERPRAHDDIIVIDDDVIMRS